MALSLPLDLLVLLGLFCSLASALQLDLSINESPDYFRGARSSETPRARATTLTNADIIAIILGIIVALLDGFLITFGMILYRVKFVPFFATAR